MKEFIMNPAVWGPLLAFAGLVIGHFTAGWGRKKEYDLSALQASVAVLQAEYERLTKEVEKLRATLAEERAAGFVALEEERKKRRVVTEKYSVSLTDNATIRIAAIALFLRLDAAGFDHADLPPVPLLIEADMRHQWPEVFDT